MMMSVPSTSLSLPAPGRRGGGEVGAPSAEAGSSGKKTKSTKQRQRQRQHAQGVTVSGRSRAGDGTAFAVPELGLLLDCGALIELPAGTFAGGCGSVLLLTHTHSDHVQALATVVRRLGWDGTGGGSGGSGAVIDVYLPAPALHHVERHLTCFQEMIDGDYCDDDDDDDDDQNRAVQYGLRNNKKTSKKNYRLIPVNADASFSIRRKGAEVAVQTYRCDHRIVCYGYGVSRTKRVLKPEYAHLSSSEIGQLVREQKQNNKKNFEVTTAVSEPLFAFMGDTTGRLWKRYPDLPSLYPVIFVECTYIDAQDAQKAIDYAHMHWNDLRDLVKKHTTTLFCLIHFSLKYSSLTIRRFFNDANNNNNNNNNTEGGSSRNIHPMILQEEVEREWEKSKLKKAEAARRRRNMAQRDNNTRTDNADSEQRPEGSNAEQEEEAEPPTCNCFRCRPSLLGDGDEQRP